MTQTLQNKILTAMVIDKDIDDLHKVIESLMKRFNETIVVCTVSKNELPSNQVIQTCNITVVENIYDRKTRNKLQELSRYPIRYISLSPPSAPVVPVKVPGVTVELGGEAKIVVEETPVIPEKLDKKPSGVSTKPAPALRSTPILKKLSDELLYSYVLQEHARYNKDLHGKMLAPNIIIKFYKIMFPTDIDIDHVAKQIDTWARNHPKVRYNPIRKKFCPKIC